MLKAKFSSIGVNGEQMSPQDMLPAFDIYCLDTAAECFLLIAKGNKNCPLVLVDHGAVKFVFPEGDGKAEFEALMAQAQHAERMDADRVPMNVQTDLLIPLASRFSYEEKADK